LNTFLDISKISAIFIIVEKFIYGFLAILLTVIKMAINLEIPAIRFIQRNFPYIEEDIEEVETPIYVTALPLEVLNTKCTIDRRTPDDPEGYQRNPDERRMAKEMVRYLTGEIGAYPTSTLVNIRDGDKVKFTPESETNGIEIGKLIVPEDVKFYLIDGQHRIESLKRAMSLLEKISDNWAKKIKKYPLPVSILVTDRRLEMVHFYVVNSRQKSVPTDLAFTIIQRMFFYDNSLPKYITDIFERTIKPSQVWMAKAMEVTEMLNEDSRSVWRGKIQRYGEERHEEHILTAKAFAQSLKYILKDRSFIDLPENTHTQYLMDYWQAIFEIYPEALQNPKRYTITTYTGLNALHMLFPFIYSTSIAEMNAITKDTMKKLLSHLRNETFEHPDLDFKKSIEVSFWDKASAPAIFRATNAKLVRELSEKLRTKIQLAMQKVET
jgi:DGQHR domain-containing protein